MFLTDFLLYFLLFCKLLLLVKYLVPLTNLNLLFNLLPFLKNLFLLDIPFPQLSIDHLLLVLLLQQLLPLHHLHLALMSRLDLVEVAFYFSQLISLLSELPFQLGLDKFPALLLLLGFELCNAFFHTGTHLLLSFFYIGQFSYVLLLLCLELLSQQVASLLEVSLRLLSHLSHTRFEVLLFLYIFPFHLPISSMLHKVFVFQLCSQFAKLFVLDPALVDLALGHGFETSLLANEHNF